MFWLWLKDEQAPPKEKYHITPPQNENDLTSGRREKSNWKKVTHQHRDEVQQNLWRRRSPTRSWERARGKPQKQEQLHPSDPAGSPPKRGEGNWTSAGGGRCCPPRTCSFRRCPPGGYRSRRLGGSRDLHTPRGTLGLRPVPTSSPTAWPPMKSHAARLPFLPTVREIIHTSI